MNYYKRFGDFCAGFTIFADIMYLLRKFMVFEADDAEGIFQKLKLFFDSTNFANRAHLVLIALLLSSLVLGLIFERLPYIGFTVSLIPLTHSLLMISEKYLEKNAVFYLLLIAVHVTGQFICALNLDRADGKRRAFICANICGATIPAFALLVKRTASALAALTEEEMFEKDAFFREIYDGLEDGGDKLIMKIAIITIVTVVLSFILRDIYFLDAALSAVPFGYTLYLAFAEKLTMFELLMFIVTFAYFVFKLLLVFFEPMAKKKDKTSKTKSENKNEELYNCQ